MMKAISAPLKWCKSYHSMATTYSMNKMRKLSGGSLAEILKAIRRRLGLLSVFKNCADSGNLQAVRNDQKQG